MRTKSESRGGVEDGGTWIFFGSFAFYGRPPADAILADELGEQLAQAGFELEHQEDVTVPYLRSPYSRFARSERCVTFRARKQKHFAQKRVTSLPDWISNPTLSIPKLDKWIAEGIALKIAAETLLAPNGSISIAQLAPAVAQVHRMSEAEAVKALQTFFVAKIKT